MKFKKLIPLFLSIAVLSSCAENPDKESGLPPAVTETVEDKASLYLSITETCNNGQDSSDGMTTTELIYDLDKGELKEIASVAYTSQYPLAIYSREDNILYFTADEETGHNRDQVFGLDIATGECYRFSDELFAINYIVPTKDKLIMIAAGIGERNLSPYIYEKATGEFYKLPVYEDFTVRCCDYNPITERLFISGFLESQDYALLMELNDQLHNGAIYEETPQVLADNYIFELTDNYSKPIQRLFVKEQGIVGGLPSDTRDMIYLCLSYTAPHARIEPKTNSKVLNIQTGELIDSGYFAGLPIDVSSYTMSGDDFYILGMSPVGDYTYPRGIYRYRPGGEPELLYQQSETAFINQFSVCRDTGTSNLDLTKAKKVQLIAAQKDISKAEGNVEQIPDISEENTEADNETGSGVKIPLRMQALTIIEYISDSEYTILQGGEPEPGLYNENGLTDEEQAALDERNKRIEEMYPDLPRITGEGLPSPVKGMKVEYDQVGEIIRIVMPGEEEQ